MTNILTWVVLGLVAGFLAKVIMPGKDSGGLIKTAILGVAGAFVGGLVGKYAPIPFLKESAEAALSWPSVATATLGAIVLLALGRLFRGDKG